MTFQISGLPAATFAPLFSLSDAQLAERNIRRIRVDSSPGFPCRVSLRDAAVGETVLLLNYAHHEHATPYAARHAIFVRERAEDCGLAPGQLPEVFSGRVLSIRAFDDLHDMVAADLAEGEGVKTCIDAMFQNAAVAYLHVHNAKPGCFAARVDRAAPSPARTS